MIYLITAILCAGLFTLYKDVGGIERWLSGKFDNSNNFEMFVLGWFLLTLIFIMWSAFELYGLMLL